MIIYLRMCVGMYVRMCASVCVCMMWAGVYARQSFTSNVLFRPSERVASIVTVGRITLNVSLVRKSFALNFDHLLLTQQNNNNNIIIFSNSKSDNDNTYKQQVQHFNQLTQNQKNKHNKQNKQNK